MTSTNKESLVPEVPGTIHMEMPSSVENNDELGVKTVTSCFDKSYANALKKSYPNVVLDFECLNHEEQVLSQTMLANFLFQDLVLQKEKIKALVIIGKGKIVKVVTKESIDVSARFSNRYEIIRSYEEKKWKCVVRGACKSSVLRILGVPCEITDEDLIGQVACFAEVSSKVGRDRFGEKDDPRLIG